MNSTSAQVNQIWGFYGTKINKPMISIINKLSPKIRKIIHIPRQNNWILDSNGENVNFIETPTNKMSTNEKSTNYFSANRSSTNQFSTNGQEKVKCIFLQDSEFGKSPKDSLVGPSSWRRVHSAPSEVSRNVPAPMERALERCPNSVRRLFTFAKASISGRQFKKFLMCTFS